MENEKKIFCLHHSSCPPTPPFQLHHEATVINLLETIMFHQVGLLLQTLVLKGHNNIFINGEEKQFTFGSSVKQKAVLLKRSHHKSSSLHTFSHACDNTITAMLHADTVKPPTFNSRRRRLKLDWTAGRTS